MSVTWRKDSVKAIREKQAAEVRAEALNAQAQIAVMAFCAAATSIPDAQALQMPDLFPLWEDVLARGEKLVEGSILKDGKVLYRVVQAGGVMPQQHQPPHGEGMLAVYRPIDQGHAGTLEDPIPWVYGMDCTAGTYYSYNGHIYQVAVGGDMVPCVWPPDTTGIWQWVLIRY